MSDQARQWPAEAGENPFGVERRPSTLRWMVVGLLRRPEHRPPQRVRLPVYFGSFVVGVLIARTAGWHEFKTGAALSLACDVLLAFGWSAVRRRQRMPETARHLTLLRMATPPAPSPSRGSRRRRGRSRR